MSQAAAPEFGPVMNAVGAALQRGDHAAARRLSEDAARRGIADPDPWAERFGYGV